MASGIARGDIRLYKFSHPDKERPVLVLTRDSVIPRLSKVTIVPISSSMRGAVSEVMLTEDDGMRQPCCLNLHNLITVEQRKVGQRVAQLSSVRMKEVCAALRFSLGCD